MIGQPFLTARCLLFAAAASIGACAMSAPADRKAACDVVGGAKLPVASGGETALCEAIAKELGSRSIVVSSVRVEVREKGRFVVTATMPGTRVLPELNFARSDGPVSASTLARLAKAIADHVVGSR